MTKRKYSKEYIHEGKTFRYNYEDCVLEYITYKDLDENDESIILEEPMVVDSSGLGKDNWEDNPEYWIDFYNEELEEEIKYLMQEFL